MPAKLRTLLVAGLAAATAFIAPAAFADRPNILVMSEDGDTETVPRNNRIFNRVIGALSEELNLRGFTIIDETAAGLNVTQPGRVRRSLPELIDIARSIPRPPIDAVVTFQIYASAKQSLYSDVMRPEVRIPGRVIAVRTGRLLGEFEVSGLDLPVLPRGCDRECVLEQVGGHARILARDLGGALAEKLAALPRAGAGVAGPAGPAAVPGKPGRTHPAADQCSGFPQAFTVVFDGFAPREITTVEEYMTAFKCYDHIRPVRVSASYAEYWYETQTDAARLNRNLRVMLDHMGLPGQIQLAGNVLKVTKVGTR